MFILLRKSREQEPDVDRTDEAQIPGLLGTDSLECDRMYSILSDWIIRNSCGFVTSLLRSWSVQLTPQYWL